MDSTQAHTYNFTVAMTCDGCSGAVKRVLSKMEGLVVEKVDWQSQEVIVHAETAIPTYEEVEAKIAKTGKQVLSGYADGVVKKAPA